MAGSEQIELLAAAAAIKVWIAAAAARAGCVPTAGTNSNWIWICHAAEAAATISSYSSSTLREALLWNVIFFCIKRSMDFEAGLQISVGYWNEYKYGNGFGSFQVHGIFLINVKKRTIYSKWTELLSVDKTNPSGLGLWLFLGRIGNIYFCSPIHFQTVLPSSSFPLSFIYILKGKLLASFFSLSLSSFIPLSLILLIPLASFKKILKIVRFPFLFLSLPFSFTPLPALFS